MSLLTLHGFPKSTSELAVNLWEKGSTLSVPLSSIISTAPNPRPGSQEVQSTAPTPGKVSPLTQKPFIE